MLRSLAANFEFVESLRKSHGDGKPANFVVFEMCGNKLTKMIDFDGSADYDQPCYL